MGRDVYAMGNAIANPVSTHAPAWGAITGQIREDEDGTSFNSRARMGRDLLGIGLGREIHRVSTHAPAWGAM